MAPRPTERKSFPDAKFGKVERGLVGAVTMMGRLLNASSQGSRPMDRSWDCRMGLPAVLVLLGPESLVASSGTHPPRVSRTVLVAKPRLIVRVTRSDMLGGMS